MILNLFSTFQTKIQIINSYFLIALLFVIPFSTALGSIFSGLVFIFWILQANFINQYYEIRANRVAIASLMFFLLHALGLIWTLDIEWGLHTLKKEWKFLMLPIFMLYARKEHIRYYIYSFVLAMSISELISYGIWFEQIPPFKNATVFNPTPFMTHVTYNPLLAIAIYLIASDILFHKSHSNSKRAIYFLFLVTMTFNMFITGGRSGQIILFVAIIVLTFQYFSFQFFKALLTSLLVSFAIFFVAYSQSNIFNERFDMAINNLVNYEQNKNSSTGKRLTYAINGINIFSENPIFGVGTGDLPKAMQESHSALSPEVEAPDNPHNMYIMMAVQFGILGLISLAWLFYVQMRFSLRNTNDFLSRFGIALPILFLVGNLGESYFSVHATSLVFSVFSAIAYKQYYS